MRASTLRIGGVLAALALSIGAVSCAGLTLPPSAAVVSVKADKALYLAEAAFHGANLAAEAAVDNGLLKGERAGRVQVGLLKAHDALLIARRASSIGHAAEAQQQIVLTQALVADLWPLIPAARKD